MKFLPGKRAVIGLLAVAAVMLLPLAAQAITFTGSSGTLAASATFYLIDATHLGIVLTNTSANDVGVPSDVLTGLFWDGSPNLTRVSAVLSPGSTVFYDSDGQPAGGVVGGEWAYVSGLVGAPHGATQGISSAGLDLFGPGDRFPGADLAPPASVDGVNYGILSAGDNTATGNTGVLDSGGQIKNSVTFVLSSTTGFSPISNVSFQYGTALNEPNVPGEPGGGTPNIPVPPTVWLLGSGLVGLGLIRWRRKIR